MNILIPMAGAGSRFARKGYMLPKPLIPIDGLPMIIKAVNQLPSGSNHHFVCRQNHLDDFKVDKSIQQYYPNANFISVNKLTEGQASTCLLAEKQINNEKELLIGACDNGMIFNLEKFNQLRQEVDCIIFTFRNSVTVEHKPEQYGWVRADSNNNVEMVSVKIPISDDPINDHAIVGAFWFKKGKYFVEAANQMINENRRINNEFYVDECINDVVNLGLKVKVFEVDKYICWGTPNDLRTYNYWKLFFNKYAFEN